MRAVLDPNVIVSAILSRRGKPAKILSEWLGGAFELIVSPKLIAELERVPTYPKIRKHIAEDEAAELVDLLLRLASQTTDPEELPAEWSADPGDDYLIALAQGESSVLVSGDTHLLKLAKSLPVYSPRDFLELIESS